MKETYEHNKITVGDWSAHFLYDEPNGQVRWSIGKNGPRVYITATLDGAIEILKAFAERDELQRQLNEYQS